MFVFSQDLPHEGAPVGEGHRKIIIRTDVMYKRDPPVCADADGLEAYALWQKAQARAMDPARSRVLASEKRSPALPMSRRTRIE